MHRKEENKYKIINQWITNVWFQWFHFPKKYVALIIFIWINISLYCWKLFEMNNLKYFFQLFVWNKLYMFLNDISLLKIVFQWVN